jgi:ubiquinone/menaquinone biosynthesis C-methylase UbiE
MKHSAELLPYFSEVTAVDISLNREIYPNIKKIEGLLSNVTVTLPDNRYNAVLLNSVLEHVKEPQELLNECYRILDNGGIFYVSVPTWKDKFFLEWTAFTLNIAHAKIEMNDHKMYYEKKDLWPMLVKAGFLPEKIKLSYYKFGLNLLGICRKENL